VGGAVVAAPFLSSVAERASKGQPVSRPRQLIAMFTHNGCITTKFFPAKSHGALTAGDLTATNLAPLAPYVGKILIPRGMRAMNEWTQNNKGAGYGRGQGNDPYLNALGSYFTCQPVTPNQNEPFSFDSNTKFSAKPIGTSLDHVIAQQLGSSGLPLYLRVGGYNESPQACVSYLKPDGLAIDAPANMYSGAGSPAQVFAALTGLFGTGGMNGDTYAMIRGKKLCDVVKGDLEALERLDMSAEDRNKIARWKALCNDAGTVISAQCTMDLATRLGATAANVATASTRTVGTDILTNPVTPDLDGADMNSVMAVLAAACNYNPVIVLKYPSNYVFSGLGISVDSASLAHRLDNAGLSGTCYPNALTLLQTIDKYYAAKFAKLVGMLDGVDNGDGSTLLDNTATVWFNQFSDGLAFNLNNLPVIQAGSCGGYFKTGWAVNVDTMNAGASNLSQGNSESQCGPGSSGLVNGIDQSTGTAATIANGPINKYFCNLMNALGVKADATGYPAKGGTAEVTKFGYSDKTTDFCGGYGAVAGAGIHNPGEYTALKA
jgi:hypothetical protein